MKPLTVVITSFNRESFIGPSIESVLNNDFPDFELLVLDDASTDGTVEIARRYARDERVRVEVNDRNLGQFANRNRAIELVTTPFLKYHDSDDLMYPHCLETMMRLLVEEPSAGFALSAGRAWSGGPCPMLLTPRMAYEREYLGPGMFFGGPSAALFRTHILRELGGFPERGVASDHCFWLKACAVTSVVLVPADLFWYRIHEGQELQSKPAARDYAIGHGESWRALLAPECPLEGAALERAKRNFMFLLMKLSWRDLRAGRWSLASLRLRSAGIGPRDLFRYAPRRKRDPLAGTPLTQDGEYVVPDWLHLQDNAMEEGRKRSRR
ncbi:MAG: glycosyltransferase family 2 protein [Vicinamibacteria bacterium]